MSRFDVRLIPKWVIVCGALLVVGVTECLIDSKYVVNYLYPFQRDAFIQLGTLGLVVFCGLWIGRRISPDRTQGLLQQARPAAARLLLSLVVGLLVGELVVRVIFWGIFWS